MLYEAGNTRGVEVTQLEVHLSVTFTATHPPTVTHTQLCEAEPLVYIGQNVTTGYECLTSLWLRTASTAAALAEMHHSLAPGFYRDRLMEPVTPVPLTAPGCVFHYRTTFRTKHRPK